MSDSIFSPSWYRVSDLKPRLRSHIQISRHRYREQLWYVLQDHSNARYHRFTPAAWHIIGLMDGERELNDIWDATTTEFGDDAPTQDEVIHLLGQLHGSDLLQCDISPDSEELFQRYEKDQFTKIKRRLLSPLALRLPLYDPERLLKSGLSLVRPLFSYTGFVIWLMVIAFATMLAASHWPELSHNVADRVLTPQNLLLMWLAFPCIKLLHELGHAFATRVWGGEVHEMGITLLVLTPVPYVDASASSAFKEKHKRILVSAAGMMVEMFVAAIALFLWILVEDGLFRELLFDIILIGSVSTLLFNANPLLRFDGYFMLSDAVEIPSLGARAQNYLAYLLKRYVFGVTAAESPVTAKGEPAWFVFYGIAAFIYRLFITFVIVIFIASKFFLLGVLLALWALITQIILPLGKAIASLFLSEDIGRQRLRAIGTTAVVSTGLAFVVTFVPVPFWTQVEGVVWIPEQAHVRAGVDGTVTELMQMPGMHVDVDAALVRLEDPFLDANIAVLEAKLREALVRYDAIKSEDRVEAEMIQEEISDIRAELTMNRENAEKLVVSSHTRGEFIVLEPQHLPGRFVHKGDLLGYVIDEKETGVRAVVTQSDILLIRQRTLGVEIKLVSHPWQTIAAGIEHEVPAANFRLPSKVLGHMGGGRIAVDLNEESGLQAREKVFQFQLALHDYLPSTNYGERVHVRFVHGNAPLGKQWYWQGRQLMLRHFGV